MDQGSPAKAARARRQQAARGGPHQPAGQQPRVQEQPTPQKRRQTVPTPLAKLIRAEERLRQREVKTERNKREAKARRSEEQEGRPPAAPPVTPQLKRRRQTQRWTSQEVAELQRLVAMHGEGQWALVLKQGRAVFAAGRTSVDIKDKWRNLNTPPRQREGDAGPSQKRGRVAIPWDSWEVEELRRQVELHGGSNWLLVQDQGRGVFRDRRTAVDLKDKWRLLQRKAARAERELQAAAPRA
ncbi:hypothetical protein CHLNCDRAFT_56603 [Chlorella variabilis]|uniref:Myb-like domain-containing protein n=1 Tax=Chlorella variabilis TaxID=554065 RepID=E1Z3D1_CHLVA|nr:hypothetical protein CHLNCDRAFT_56603 [Chlorella variabilis]EFN59822.1 hypothetical protein CHLNCDRAFT_56603 [Chlorella variabilis]|eukprot:XP_005851924.1 hypothetical protein CHLNCDRAFT_56603 [Chlorella variabilis]